VIGGSWLVRWGPFGGLGNATVILVTLEVSSYDERFGAGIVRDRYVFYVAPVFALAVAAALGPWRRPGRGVAGPLRVRVLGVLGREGGAGPRLPAGPAPGVGEAQRRHPRVGRRGLPPPRAGRPERRPHVPRRVERAGRRAGRRGGSPARAARARRARGVRGR